MMIIPLIFSFAIIAVIVYILVRIIGDIIKGTILLLFIFLIYLAFFHSFSSLRELPFIGSFIGSFTDGLDAINQILYKLNIVAVSRSPTGNLLLTMQNTGILPLSNFTVYVDGKDTRIINMKEVLYPRETETIEVNWKEPFRNLTIVAGKAVASLGG